MSVFQDHYGVLSMCWNTVLSMCWNTCRVCIAGTVRVPVRNSARIHVVPVFQDQHELMYEIVLEYMSCLYFRISTDSCTR